MNFKNTDNFKTNEIKLKLIKTTDAQPDKNWLPAYHFDICLLNDIVIGKCNLRIGHNEKTYIGGNIGYLIEEEYRGNNYAAKSCDLLFSLAKSHGMENLIITCGPDNIPSYKTCEKCGGELLEIADIPKDNELYEEGKRKVRVYKFIL